MEQSEPPVGLWTISGPSGAGKTTLCKALMRRFPYMQPLLRVTTREKRSSDIRGEYEYVSLKQFTRLSREGVFVTIVSVHDYFHAARTETLDAALSAEHVTLVDVSPDIAEELIHYAATQGKRRLIKSVYLNIQDEAEIARRLRQRKQNKIDERIAQCRGWMDYVRTSSVPFYVIDARQPPQQVFEQALKFFLAP